MKHTSSDQTGDELGKEITSEFEGSAGTGK